MARVPKMARGLLCYPKFFLFLLPDQRLYIVKKCVCVCVCVYLRIYTHLTAYRLYMHYRRYQIKLLVKHLLHQSGGGAKC